jgi:hypothetical protein
MNWKGFRKKRSWPNFKVLSWHFSGGTEENDENLSQVNRSPGRDFNPRPPEYEAGVLATRPRHSMILYKIVWQIFIELSLPAEYLERCGT